MIAELLPAIAAEDGSGGFHAPSISDFFPPAVLFEGTIFEFTRLQFAQIIAAAVILSVFMIAAKRAKLVPGRFQNAVEMILDFCRVQIVESVMDGDKGKKYVPMVTTIFVSILAFNLTGLLPGINLAGTSRIGVPLLLALWVFYAYWAAGIKKFGLWGYLRNNMFPPGVPVFVYPILAPIELLQLLVIRPGSLLLRLMANMVAGHIMLALTYLATQYLLFTAAPAMKGLGALTFVGAFGLSLFEIFVAALQAYIFALLAAVYINMSLEEDH